MNTSWHPPIRTHTHTSRYCLQKYVEKNIFLADINNERSNKNQTYKKNFVSLNKFVMVEYV